MAQDREMGTPGQSDEAECSESDQSAALLQKYERIVGRFQGDIKSTSKLHLLLESLPENGHTEGT